MKILSSEQIRSLDRFTIEHEPIASIDLMERAAGTCLKSILERFPETKHYTIICGPGNNGGDGLAIARMLCEQGRYVSCFLLETGHPSADNQINFERISNMGVHVVRITENNIPTFGGEVIIDALFGTGLSRPLTGVAAETINKINSAGLPVISIDLPSGLYDRGNTAENLSSTIKATLTLSFQVPKLCFYLPETGPYVGDWQVLDIGLSAVFLDQLESSDESYSLENARKDLIKRNPFGHKGSFGHSLLIGGSYGKIGAIALASNACLHTGAGLTTAYTPRCANEILQASLPELMLIHSSSEQELSGKPELHPFSAIGIGPGMGTSTGAFEVLRHAIASAETSHLVIDADGLNLLGLHPELIELLPKGTVLTPHPKEFERLFGAFTNTEEKIAFMRKLAVKQQINILLKGHHSISATSNGMVYYNTSGNVGMAKGGSGDVLTGIITGLLSQGHVPEKALPLGVYLHGLAGDLACAELGNRAYIASDLIHQLGMTFRLVESDQEK